MCMAAGDNFPGQLPRTDGPTLMKPRLSALLLRFSLGTSSVLVFLTPFVAPASAPLLRHDGLATDMPLCLPPTARRLRQHSARDHMG